MREGNVILSRRVILYLLFATILTACAHIAAVDESILQKWLPFIEDGKTIKDEILLTLGRPSRQFEGGRILTYQMTFSGKRGFRIDPEREFKYNLVLVFDERNILQKHRMLKLKPY